ncbi:unnamed protein product [Linum trigynum]|uniref:Gibberellin-regulated protein 14 n=1 Tax=Linum trigynum TaxID=586398 RepID=A0AAV2CNQ5_9ROSI
MASRSMLLLVLAATVLAVSSYADQDHPFISQEAVSSTKYAKSPPPPSTPVVKPAPTPSPSPSPPAKPSPPPLVKPVPSPSPPPSPPYKKPPTPTPSPAVPKPPTHSPAPVPVPKPPTAAPPSPSPFVRSIKDCAPLCANRCKLHSRPNRCNRACVSCCSKCKCVPPGTSGNREKCGTCYTGLTTKFNQPKCP